MLGDMLLKTARRERLPEIGPLLGSAAGRGGSIRGRMKSVSTIINMLRRADQEHAISDQDPLQITRQKLSTNRQRLRSLEAEVIYEMETVVRQSLMDQAIREGLS
jgi:hypothetical protein